MHQDNYNIQYDMRYPIAFQEIHDQDTIYFHKAMQQPDNNYFVKSIVN